MFPNEPSTAELSMRSGCPGLMQSFHSHREIEINLIESGSMTYMFGGSRIVLQPGAFAVFWATIPHRVVHIAPDSRFYCVNLALSCFLRWQMPQEFTSRLLRGEMIREPDATQEDMDRLRFENWRTDLGSANSDMLKIVESEVQARLRRLAIRVAQSPRTRSDNVAPADKQSIDKVEQIARHIGEHYHDSITIDDIGRVVELHPKYAASLFKKHCGMTIGEYITEHRLSQAKRLLATTELKIVDIAFEAGFNSVSRFYEVFELNCGQTPKAYRAHLFAPAHKVSVAPEYTPCNIT